MSGKTIGIVGARGISNYGGYERMLADLVPRLIQKGYAVRCTCEKPADGKIVTCYKGAALDYFPFKPPSNYTLRKVFELLYDFFFVLKYAILCDAVYVLGIYGGAALLFPRLLGRDVVVNTDGLEWERSKYNIAERSIIKLYFAVSINLASGIVVDNQELRRFIAARHQSKICYIPYGVTYERPQPWEEARLRPHIARENGERSIEPGKYWLLVARLEPENNIDVAVKGFIEGSPQNPLLVVGDFTSEHYKKQVYAEMNGGSAIVHFLGPIYDLETLTMLRQHCLAYIHGHSVGGTNPSLLEAMASSNLIIAHDNPFNKEVCGRFAHYFSNSGQLSSWVASTERNPKGYWSLRSNVYERTAAYSWEQIGEQYHKLFRGDGEATRVRREIDAAWPTNEQPP